MSAVPTSAQRAAVEWLRKRGGDGCFDRNGVALAQGETAPVTRTTWNALRDAGIVEFYGGARDGGRGYGRLRLTDAAASIRGHDVTGAWHDEMVDDVG